MYLSRFYIHKILIAVASGLLKKLQNETDLPLLQSGIHFCSHRRGKYWNLPEKRSKRKLVTLYIHIFRFQTQILACYRCIDYTCIKINLTHNTFLYCFLYDKPTREKQRCKLVFCSHLTNKLIIRKMKIRLKRFMSICLGRRQYING